MADPYRYDEEALGQPLRAWDVVETYHDIRLMGIAGETHLADCQVDLYPHLCKCFTVVRTTSRLLDPWGNPYTSRFGDEGRCMETEDAIFHDLFRRVKEGAVLRTESGTHYVLTGMRKVGGHQGFHNASIFRHLDHPKVFRPLTWRERLRDRIEHLLYA